MAILPGFTIGIPPARTKAQKILASMKSLLAKRHRYEIGRKAFLTQWSKLRMALFLTPEYEAFRATVLARCNHTCERCKTARAVHVHHTKQLSYHPNLALVPSLAEGRCRECHDAEHARD